ncbi:MAG: MBL fold metallo-hydrolase [Thermoplasmata archaeon]|nr:MBL fold metallo-hydrolase [Thermoplasmata archaeon]
MVGSKPERLQIQPVGKGVWAAIGRRGAGVTSNAGIVDLGNVTLIVDSFLTLQAAQELRTASRLLTGRDPSVVVNTHWHFDHCLGNVIFRDCEIYSTAGTREWMLSKGEPFVRTVQGEPGVARLRQLEAAASAESRPLFREELESEMAARRALFEMSSSLRVYGPNQVYDTRYNLPAQDSAWIVEVRGHTMSESMVFVPDAEVLFTGDIVVSGVHPNLVSADLKEWSAALSAVEKIAPARIVPGHGPVTGTDALGPLRDYFRTLWHAAADRGPAAMPVPFSEWYSPSQFEVNLQVLRTRRGTPPPT